MKRIIFLLFICFSNSTLYCQEHLSNKQLKHIFKEIKKSDKSNLDNSTQRHLDFIKNFDQIIQIIKNEGFPKSDKKRINELMENGTCRTFIHILQTKPELLLNDEIIELLRVELEANNLSPEILKTAFKVYKYDLETSRIKKITNKEQEQLNSALKIWGITI